MARNRHRRKRADREVTTLEMDELNDIIQRCGKRWVEAMDAATANDITPFEFRQADFDCRQCPFFLACHIEKGLG